MPWTMVERPGRVRMISAAARAASVAPCTATPTSALFKAGASFTPSPVIPVLYPSSRRHSTMRYLCSGYTYKRELDECMYDSTKFVLMTK